VRCAIAIDSAAAVLASGLGRALIVGPDAVGLLNERCQVRSSRLAQSAVLLLDGEMLVIADEGRLLFIDPTGEAVSSARVPDEVVLVPAADGGNLMVMAEGVSVFDPWGRLLGQIPLGESCVARAVAGGPDRVYVAAACDLNAGDPTAGTSTDQVLAHTLDGALAWRKQIAPEWQEPDIVGEIGVEHRPGEVEISDLWAWPDGRGVLVAVAEHEPGRVRVRERRLLALDPDGNPAWHQVLDEALETAGIDVTFAGGSGDVAVTHWDEIHGVRRSAVLVLSASGHLRARLRIPSLTRAGGARLSENGRYLLANMPESGLLRLFAVP
jgi:hypothetical protein